MYWIRLPNPGPNKQSWTVSIDWHSSKGRWRPCFSSFVFDDTLCIYIILKSGYQHCWTLVNTWYSIWTTIVSPLQLVTSSSNVCQQVVNVWGCPLVVKVHHVVWYICFRRVLVYGRWILGVLLAVAAHPPCLLECDFYQLPKK